MVGCVYFGICLFLVALHGIEASFLAESSVRKLRAAFCRVSWSSRQPLAHVGAVLSLLDGPVGCDPAFCVVWFPLSADAQVLGL